MPRYFFRLRDGEVVRDEEGEELADNDAACAAAVEVFAETIPSKSGVLMDGGDYEVMVTDAGAAQVYSITAKGQRY